MKLWLVTRCSEEFQSAPAQGGISRLNRARRIGPLQLFFGHNFRDRIANNDDIQSGVVWGLAFRA
jgi:hypothetical protein